MKAVCALFVVCMIALPSWAKEDKPVPLVDVCNKIRNLVLAEATQVQVQNAIDEIVKQKISIVAVVVDATQDKVYLEWSSKTALVNLTVHATRAEASKYNRGQKIEMEVVAKTIRITMSPSTKDAAIGLRIIGRRAKAK